MHHSASPVSETKAIDRDPLVRRVVASQARLIRIVAPAGYGKTRFALSLSRQICPIEPIDCRDMLDINSGVRTVLRTLGPYAPDFEERLARHILALKRDPSDDDRWRDLLDEAIARADGANWCWFDNAEELNRCAAASEIANRVLRNSRYSAIVCSRVELQLAALSRTPPNETYRISIDDLKFSDAECVTLFDSSHAKTEIDSAISLARGWPIAALTFARADREGRLSDMLASARTGSALADFDTYTLNEALGVLSPEALATVAAIALLGHASPDDIDLITLRAQSVLVELAACPLVLERGGMLEVHPIAASALAPLRDQSEARLRAGAKRAENPLRAAEIYIAAGDAESAASVLDSSVVPFFYGNVTAGLAEIVGAIDRRTLVRHAATWCATGTLRVYAMSPEEFLAEARAAWAHVDDHTPLQLRIGVALLLMNSLLLYFDRTEEALEILSELERLASQPPSDIVSVTLLIMWRAFAVFRTGVAFDEALMEQKYLPALNALPMVQLAYLISFRGTGAFLRGDRERARRAFAAALENSRNAESVTYQVLALTNGAFHAWLCGEDVLFKEYVAELQNVTEPSVWHGTHHFIACATEPRPASAPVGFETRYIRAFGYVVAAVRETDGARRRNAARAAVDAAIESGEAWLVALCRLCVGLCDSTARADAFSHAIDAAKRVKYPAFREKIAAAIAGDLPKEWRGLQPLLSATRQSTGLHLRLGSCELSINGNVASVSRREMEMLLALALRPIGRDRKTLAAMIWPDLDEADGANAVTVNVSRLRKKLGDPEMIQSAVEGYRLAGNFTLDLLELEKWSRNGKPGPLADPELEHLVSTHHTRLPQWIVTSEWLAPYAHRYDAALDGIRTQRATRAIDRGDESEAAHYNRLVDG